MNLIILYYQKEWSGDMEKRLEYALEFLMYSYFGATFKHCDDELSEIEKCAAAKAYNDATMRAALVTKDKTLEDKNGYQDAIRFNVKEALVAEIVKMFSSENVLELDWHEKICKELVESFNKKYQEQFKKIGTIKIVAQLLHMAMHKNLLICM